MTEILAQMIRAALEIYETAEMWALLLLVCLTVNFSAAQREIDDAYGERE